MLLILLMPLSFALAAMAFPLQVRWQKITLVLGAASSLIFAIWTMMLVDSQGIQVIQFGGWEAPVGITFVADRMSALMTVVTALVSTAIAVYACNDISKNLFQRQFTALTLFLITGAQGAYLTGDLFNLYVWFEVLLVSSFVLMVIGSKKHQLQGAIKYFVVNLISSALFLIGAGLVYGKIGTLNMADIARSLSMSNDADLISTSGVLLLVAFGLKAGLFPLCFWLPASYHTPPSSVTALFAGIMTKVGLYSIFRAMTLVVAPSTDEFQPIFMVIAMLTMLVGVLGAVGQFNIKSILSIHIISQVGYIFAGFAILTVSSVAAALFYLVHNIIVKANLFLIAGIAGRINGSDNLPQMGGLVKLHPILSTAFFLSAFSLAGLPPLSGFWAKFGILASSLEGAHWWMAGFVVVVSFFTLLSMIKIWLAAFWQPLPEAPKEHPNIDLIPKGSKPALLWIPCLTLALISIAIGLFGPYLYDYSTAAAQEVLESKNYIQAVLGS